MAKLQFDTMTEIFKDIPGYENIYQVSNVGNVKSLKYGNTKILAVQENAFLYKTIRLGKDNVYKGYKVHRLVALSFINKISGKNCINHKNGKRDDNRVENLEWCTHSENAFHSVNVLGRKPTYGNRGNTGIKNRISVSIKQFTKLGEFIKEWGCIKEAGSSLGIAPQSICNNARGDRKSAGGFIWKYKNHEIAV